MTAAPAPDLRPLTAYAALTYPFACVPFLYFHFRDRGVDVAGYADLIAIYYLVMVVVEVPTGLLADRFGRKATMVLGPMVLAAGFAALWLGEDFASFALGEGLLGLGHSLLSGPPSALLFDTLAAAGLSDRYLRCEARIHAVRTFGTAVAFLVGGCVAYFWDAAATIALSAALCASAGLVAFGLREPPRVKQRARHLLANAWRELRQAAVRWILAYYVLVFCLLRYCFHTYQPYLQEAGEERPLLVGLLFFALNAVATPWSQAVPSLVRRFGERTLLWVMPLAMAVALLVMAGAVGWLGIALFFAHQAPFGAHWAVIQNYANHRLASSSRATTLSLLSLAGRLVFTVLFPLLGWLHARHGLTAAYVAAGSAGVLATAWIMARMPK